MAVFTRTHTGALVSQFSDASGRGSQHPHTVGGNLTSNVLAIVDSHGRVNVFSHGANGAVYRVVQSTIGRWGSFARLGGRATMGPAVVRTTNGLDVFVAGRNHALYQAFQTSSSRTGWSGWHSRGVALPRLPPLLERAARSAVATLPREVLRNRTAPRLRARGPHRAHRGASARGESDRGVAAASPRAGRRHTPPGPPVDG